MGRQDKIIKVWSHILKIVSLLERGTDWERRHWVSCTVRCLAVEFVSSSGLCWYYDTLRMSLCLHIGPSVSSDDQLSILKFQANKFPSWQIPGECSGRDLPGQSEGVGHHVPVWGEEGRPAAGQCGAGDGEGRARHLPPSPPHGHDPHWQSRRPARRRRLPTTCRHKEPQSRWAFSVYLNVEYKLEVRWMSRLGIPVHGLWGVPVPGALPHVLHGSPPQPGQEGRLLPALHWRGSRHSGQSPHQARHQSQVWGVQSQPWGNEQYQQVLCIVKYVYFDMSELINKLKISCSALLENYSHVLVTKTTNQNDTRLNWNSHQIRLG